MRKRVAMSIVLGVVAMSVAGPVAAGSANIDRLSNIDSVLAVRMDADFPIASLMRADCSSLIRVERPDGSATEILDCHLTNRPVMIPEFQGVAPSQAFVLKGGPCQWHSEYWFNTAGLDVLAASFQYTVTPSGHVHAISEYPAVPLTCE